MSLGTVDGILKSRRLEPDIYPQKNNFIFSISFTFEDGKAGQESRKLSAKNSI